MEFVTQKPPQVNLETGPVQAFYGLHLNSSFNRKSLSILHLVGLIPV